jgi:hypothetical protein
VKALTEDSIGNAWLVNRKIFRQRKHVSTLKMRAKMNGDMSCRKCNVQKETLGRILGQCTYTKRKRIERHDEIEEDSRKGKEEAITRQLILRSPQREVLKPVTILIRNLENIEV